MGYTHKAQGLHPWLLKGNPVGVGRAENTLFHTFSYAAKYIKAFTKSATWFNIFNIQHIIYANLYYVIFLKLINKIHRWHSIGNYYITIKKNKYSFYYKKLVLGFY